MQLSELSAKNYLLFLLAREQRASGKAVAIVGMPSRSASAECQNGLRVYDENDEAKYYRLHGEQLAIIDHYLWGAGPGDEDA